MGPDTDRGVVRNVLRGLLPWTWSYLWTVWIVLVIALIYLLRGPLKISESIENASVYFNNLTPKFYVALTGTSSLVSGIILIFEWWYFKKHFRHLNVFSNSAETSSESGSDSEEPIEQNRPAPECKVWRNSHALFRGAEYARYKKYSGNEPLTYYDMNLSAQDHQSFFTCDEDQGHADLEIMQVAWRERESASRIAAAREALAFNEHCAPAMILLAEEACETIAEAEGMLRRALRSAETTWRRSQQNQFHDGSGDPHHRRDVNVLVYIRRRLAMCARKQGRLREAVKMMRDIIKEFPMTNMFGVQENLIEVYLELQAYADVQALMVRYDGYDLREPKSATLCYTSALLKARTVADKFAMEYSARRGLSCAESNAVEAIARAIEYNPHVPYYLLEMRPLIMPPEHYLRRGDTEAIAYAFTNLQHWKRIDGALHLLQCTWKGAFPSVSRTLGVNYYYPYSPSVETADRELLPAWHSVSVFPKKESPLWVLVQAVFCLALCATAILIHHYPAGSHDFAHAVLVWLRNVATSTLDGASAWVPENVVGLLASRPVVAAASLSAAAAAAAPPAPAPGVAENM